MRSRAGTRNTVTSFASLEWSTTRAAGSRPPG